MRWDPFGEMVSLRQAMDSLFENALITPFAGSGGAGQQGGWGLPLDVTENADNYVVKASVPGMSADDLEVTVNGDVLTIKGEIKADAEKPGERFYLRERRYGSFVRSLSLPTQVKADAVEADYHNGVLTLTLPKTDEVKPKRIAIKSGAQPQRMIDGQPTRS
jgi:HSP20 family protein